MFCPTRGAKKYISSWTNTSVQRCLYHLFQNQSPIFCCPLFSENYLDLQVRINKMVSKHTVDYHPSPSQFVSNDFKWVYFSRIFLEFFSKPAYSTLVAEKFQIYSIKITGKYICESNNKSVHFYSCPQAKALPQVFISISQAERNSAFLANSVVWIYIFLSRKGMGGENYGAEKITKINKGIGHKFSWFHHLCNLNIFGLCFLCNNLASSMPNCEGSLS